LRQHIMKSGGHTAQSMQRGARYLLVVTIMLRTLDANCVSYSPTSAQFVMITELLNIELLGLQDGYLVGETTNVNYEREVAVNESSVEAQGDGVAFAIVRFAVGKSCMGEDECDFRMGCY
jgi:hypothetical protein